MKRDERYRAERRAVADLRPMPGNPRRHPPAQLAKLEASIIAYGFAAPILVDETGEIVAGEARWLAARNVGVAEVPVYVLAGLSSIDRAGLRLADNRIALDATWDDRLLADARRHLEGADVDLSLPGFDEAELAAPPSRKGLAPARGLTTRFGARTFGPGAENSFRSGTRPDRAVFSRPISGRDAKSL